MRLFINHLNMFNSTFTQQRKNSIVWVVVADDDLSDIDKHISDCCIGNMKTLMFPEATFRPNVGLCIFCIDFSNVWLGCRGVEDVAPIGCWAMPSMASSFGECLPLRVVQAKHRLQYQAGTTPPQVSLPGSPEA